jgi:hypothetical protein
MVWEWGTRSPLAGCTGFNRSAAIPSLGMHLPLSRGSIRPCGWTGINEVDTLVSGLAPFGAITAAGPINAASEGGSVPTESHCGCVMEISGINITDAASAWDDAAASVRGPIGTGSPARRGSANLPGGLKFAARFWFRSLTIFRRRSL